MYYVSPEFGKVFLREAVIGVECPLAPAGRGLGVQPVRGQHHEDQVGVHLLLLLLQTAHVQADLLLVLRLHSCKGSRFN